MAVVLVVGYPLPAHNPTGRVNAFNIRTDQIVRSIVAAGHRVVLCAAGANGGRRETGEVVIAGDSVQYAIDLGRRGWRTRLQVINDRVRPDCLVGVGLSGCLALTRVKTREPVWMDIYGDPTSANQARMHAVKSNRGLRTTLYYENLVLRRGDAFSAQCEPQRFALIGKMAGVGRLNRETFGYPLVHTIPPAAPPSLERGPGTYRARGFLYPESAFVYFWCGGYNAWADVDVLFAGLSYAMERNENVHFLSIGAGVVDPDSYPRFCRLAEASPFKGRFHLLGWWRPREEILDYYGQSNASICIGRSCYETELGTPTRLLEMLLAGLPAVVSAEFELALKLSELGAATAVPGSDPEALGRALLDLANSPDLAAGMATAAREAATQRYSYLRTTKPLLRWISKPVLAPDRIQARRVELARDLIVRFARGIQWRVDPRVR